MRHETVTLTDSKQKKFLAVLNGEKFSVPPVWLMRQAGRYLPEYRELRAEAGGFLDLAYNPEWATEVTMQPIRRYGFDAAILFSDILIVPHALGRDLRFEKGEGPKMTPIRDASDIPLFDQDRFDQVARPVYEAVAGIQSALADEGFDQTALIGFAGSPWTVACYMVEGGGSKDFAATRKWGYSDPDGFGRLIDVLTESTIHYLLKQIEHGAEALQLFDSWSGVLDEKQFQHWVIEPTKKIISAIHVKHPDIPIIGFPRGAGLMIPDYISQTGVQAVGLDPQVPVKWAAENLQSKVAVQGNLDPLALLSGGDAMKQAAGNILEALSDGPFIFNLGHGVIKETPPKHVSELVEFVRGWS